MRKRGRRKANVRWLPDQSWFSYLQTARFSGLVVDTPTIQTQQTELVQGGGETALQTTVMANLVRTQEDSLIIDHVSGRIHWDFLGNGGDGGDQDAQGDVLLGVGSAIWIGPKMTESGGSQTQVLTAFGDSLTNAAILDPSHADRVTQLGSFGPDGVRILWRRTWAQLVSFQQGFVDQAIGSEYVVPPGNYVDIKPRRLLRGNDSLLIGMMFYILPLTGFSGTLKALWTPDFRVAAHNTRRRR